MKLINVLKTLNWYSLLRPSRLESRLRLRRKRANWSPLGTIAAEILEHRALLSATVNLTSANGAIQLTSNTVHGEQVSIGAHRNGANVEFTVMRGTLHDSNTNTDFTVGKVFDVAVPTIRSIAVNLGAGNDIFFLNDLSTTGNVTFTGLGGGTQSADGWNIQLSSDGLATADTTIGGSLIANLGTASLNGGIFNVSSTSVHNFAIKGNLSITDAASSQTLANQIFTIGAGNVIVGGSVNITSSGAGAQIDQLIAEISSGNITIGKNVTINDSGSSIQSNRLIAQTNSTLAVAGKITINSTGATRGTSNVVMASGGNLTAGAVTINSSATSGQAPQLIEAGAGNLTVTKTVVSAATGGGGQSNQILASRAGNITIGSVTLKSSGAGSQFNTIATNGSGSLTVNGSVAISSSSTTFQLNILEAQDGITINGAVGNLTVKGSVSIASSGAGNANNDVLTQGNGNASGNLLVMGNLSITESGDGDHVTEVGTTLNTGTMTVLGSVSFNDTGNGRHGDSLFSSNAGSVNLPGTVNYHDSGNGVHTRLIFAGGTLAGGDSLTTGGLTINDAGTGVHDDEIFTTNYGGKITINGAVAVVDAGTGANAFFISAAYSHFEQLYDRGGGPVQINGSVSYDNHLNTTHGDIVGIGGNVALLSPTTITGGVTLKLANAPGQGNTLELGLLIHAITNAVEKGKSLIIGGPLNIQSGAGLDQIDLWGVQVKGFITLNSGSGTGDAVDIEGSEFDGAATTGRRGTMNSITMTGDFASLFVADAHSHGWDPTFFASGLQANLPGAAGIGQSDVVQIGRSGDGVTFNQQLFVTGATPKSPGAVSGTLFIDGPVTFNLKGVAQALPVVTNWRILSGI